MRKTHRLHSVGAVLVLSALPLVGCSVRQSEPTIPATGAPGTDATHENTSTTDDVSSIFDAAKTDYPLPLPKKIVWPDSLPAYLLAPGANMDEGVPRTQVLFYWLCAWEDEYLRATTAGDEARTDHALWMIQQYPTLPDYQKYVQDPEGGWVKDVVEPALRGDQSGIEADIRQCGYFYKNQ